MQGCHYHEEQWQNPYEFLPERHDPNNDLFKTPSGGKRSSLAYNPFGFGVRACPGKSLGQLLLKVITVMMAMFVNYDVDYENLLKEEEICFGPGSAQNLYVHIK